MIIIDLTSIWTYQHHLKPRTKTPNSMHLHLIALGLD